MSDKSSRVVYPRPPSSPEEKVRYAIPGNESTTPQRKKRILSKPTKQVPRPKDTSSGSNIRVAQDSVVESNVLNDLDESVFDTPDLMDLDYGIQANPEQLNTVMDTGSEIPSQISSSEAKYHIFIDSVLADECEVYQVSNNLFIVNGWNVQKSEATNAWYHLQRTQVGNKIFYTCLCPTSKSAVECFHGRFFREFGSQRFPEQEKQDDNGAHIYLFLRYEGSAEGLYVNLFSVPTPGPFSTLKTRVIVEYEGDDSGSGIWKCSKDGAMPCSHNRAARTSLKRHLTGDPDAEDDCEGDGGDVFHSRALKSGGSDISVSHLAIPPPIWARINSDPAFDPPKSLYEGVETLKLGLTSTCCCTTPRSVYNPFKPHFTRSCSVYGLTHSWTTSIEVQTCPLCTHRLIGPEGGDLGVFNWNNRVLFTHSLLNDYTSQFSLSETSFTSWVSNLSRRYQSISTSGPFVSDKLFRSVWFAYAQLLQLDNDLTCSVCGPTPDITIWDGVTLAFNRKHLLKTLRPPTSVDEDSLVKEKIKSQVGLQCLEAKSLRASLRFVLEGPSLLLPPIEKTPDDKDKAMMERVGRILEVTQKLEEIDESIATLFNRCYGVKQLLEGQPCHSSYKDFFLQIAAEESVLQLVNLRSTQLLRQFTRNPSRSNASCLVHIPSLSQVLTAELNCGGVKVETLKVCEWLYVRAQSVYMTLCHYGYPSTELLPNIDRESNQWKKTGCFYGLPTIRRRPKYSSIRTDQASDQGGTDQKGEGCQKFYSEYGQNRLTGGIMAVWCTHSICYGFHCIPQAEGRNDVFSAIYTRWEKAPKVIVYDFACALQPYCMTREPEFFGETLFVIDAFHSKGHTKCGKATFLTSYCRTDPTLITLNSSAAEMGNGGLLRIRKPVAYMSQERAIIYTKVFFSLWNRERLRRIEKIQR